MFDYKMFDSELLAAAKNVFVVLPPLCLMLKKKEILTVTAI